MKKTRITKADKIKRDKFRGGAEYKSLSLFIVGTIGFLLLVYVGFGLVMVSIKADRLMHGQKIGTRIPSEVGTVRRDIGNEKIVGINNKQEKVNVIVKELFGKVASVNGNVVTIETKVYGSDEKNIRLRFVDEDKGGIFKYETNNDGEESEVNMSIEELKEGMYVGVQLPVEILLSEIEKDLIYVDTVVVDTEYNEETQE